MLRIFDVALSFVGLLLSLPLLIILLLLLFLETGSPLFRQVRVGRYQQPFILLKLRTMQHDTPSVASHLVDASAITPVGRFLRRTKLDELPQLWNVLRGEMSLVGPRPCLFNQHELIEERLALRVFDARPGITGLAQINNIDMSTPRWLAETDAQMLQKLDAITYFRLILMTLLGRGFRDRVKSQHQ